MMMTAVTRRRSRHMLLLLPCLLLLLQAASPALAQGAPREGLSPDAAPSDPLLFSPLDDLLSRPKYAISFSPVESAPHGASSVDPASGGAVPYVMLAPNGLRYRCHLPASAAMPAAAVDVKLRASNAADADAAGAVPGLQADTPTKAGVRREDDPLVARALAAVAIMSKRCVTTTTGWWSYEYCHMKHIEQYHAPQRQKLSYVIGRWRVTDTAAFENKAKIGPGSAGQGAKKSVPADEHAPLIGHMDGIRYLSMRYTDGAQCDLTGLPRATEVQLMCAREGFEGVALVKEPAVCTYTAIVYSMALCQLPEFRNVVAEYAPRHVTCYPMQRLPLPPSDAAFAASSSSFSSTNGADNALPMPIVLPPPLPPRSVDPKLGEGSLPANPARSPESGTTTDVKDIVLKLFSMKTGNIVQKFGGQDASSTAQEIPKEPNLVTLASEHESKKQNKNDQKNAADIVDDGVFNQIISDVDTKIIVMDGNGNVIAQDDIILGSGAQPDSADPEQVGGQAQQMADNGGVVPPSNSKTPQNDAEKEKKIKNLRNFLKTLNAKLKESKDKDNKESSGGDHSEITTSTTTAGSVSSDDTNKQASRKENEQQQPSKVESGSSDNSKYSEYENQQEDSDPDANSDLLYEYEKDAENEARAIEDIVLQGENMGIEVEVVGEDFE